MSRLLAFLTLITGLASPGHAQTGAAVTSRVVNGSLTATGQSVTTSIQDGKSSMVVELTGTWTGTVTFNCIDAASTQCVVLNLSSGSLVNQTNGNGKFAFMNYGLQSIAVNSTGTWTGTASVRFVTGFSGGSLAATAALTPFAHEQLTFAATPIGFTATVYAPSGQQPASYAVFSCETAAATLRYWLDTSSPATTTTVGLIANQGDIIPVPGASAVSTFRAQRGGSTSVVCDIQYYR